MCDIIAYCSNEIYVMHPNKALSAVVFIRQVFCSNSPTLHKPTAGHDALQTAAIMSDTGLCPILYTLQQNISSNYQSSCAWSNDHKKQYRVFAGPQFNHGKGIVVITTPKRALDIFNFASVAKHSSSTRKLFSTTASGRKGRGIFANSHIPAGSLITRESPIFFEDQNWIEDISSEKVRAALQALAIGKLPKTTRQVFHELYGGPETGSFELKQKGLINAYGVSDTPTKNWPLLNK
ncbi:hypothetical protein CDEST_12973 [Colletotrichum destructivum]|uniref:Uncharacterized protein n=1 Tax=Colletotrichum destructivum TaxID=34406 RepID=A0AAX4IXD0_9PEZI|nr:hypothetical protein CDEST_12973 [Colletotrichum destructivum]